MYKGFSMYEQRVSVPLSKEENLEVSTSQT